MTANNFKFKQTIEALDELGSALSTLEKVLKDKKQENEKKDKKIKKLSTSTKEVINDIDGIVKKLDKVID